ncbi:hypothetical protein ABGB07_40205 [Micromonosporaceae bacterium B7E4]
MSPTDRGIVAVRRNADGTTTIDVCAEVRHGVPVGTFARHVRIPTELVRIEVPMEQAGDLRFTGGVVEVVPDGSGSVHIRPLSGGGELS